MGNGPLFRLARVVEVLGQLPRIGWLQRGIPLALAETVGQHTLLATYIALALSLGLRARGIDVNPYRVVTMAAIHDVHESVLGNASNVARESLGQWRELELSVFSKLDVFSELMGEFREYRLGTSLEGSLVGLADKLSTLVKACRYREMGFDVGELIDGYERAVRDLANGLPEEARGWVLGLINELLMECRGGFDGPSRAQ